MIRPGSPELPEGGCCHDRLTDGSEVFLLGAEASLLPCRVFPGGLASLGGDWERGDRVGHRPHDGRGVSQRSLAGGCRLMHLKN